MEVLDEGRQALAEIIVSAHVGLVHVRLAGEILVANSEWNALLLERERAGMPLRERLLITDQNLDLEEPYVRAWRELSAAVAVTRKASSRDLAELEKMLRRAADGYRGLVASWS